MILNPFKPTAGAEPPHLIGRDEVLAEFQNGLIGGIGAPGRLMRITGPRGSGKTVLLTELGDIARREGWKVADISAGPELIENLAWELSPEFRLDTVGGSANLLVGKGEAALAAKTPNLRALMKKAAHDSAGLLVTIDEVQDANADDMQAISTSVQHLIRERENVAFVFAGLPMGVMDLINGKAMTFLRRALSEELGTINDVEVGLALQESFAQTGLRIDGEELSAAAQETAGYPYLIQLVGFYVWERVHAHRDASPAATIVDVRNGAAIAMERFHQAVHEPAIAGLTRNAVDYLMLMAEHRTACSTAEIAKRMGKTAAAAGAYRRVLVQRQVIEQTAPGYVDFSIPLMREYLLDNREEILARYGEVAE